MRGRHDVQSPFPLIKGETELPQDLGAHEFGLIDDVNDWLPIGHSQEEPLPAWAASAEQIAL